MVIITTPVSSEMAGMFEAQTSIEIDDWKRAELELRDVVDTIPAILWVALPDGSNTYVNSRFVEYSGMSTAQTTGAGWQAAIHPDDLDRHDATLEVLQRYDWPGNIGELQNIIERSVILGSSEVFSVDESWLAKETLRPTSAAEKATSFHSDTKARGEREIIEAALAETRGRVSGPSGAAAKLGVPSSTLDHRIKALKINKKHFNLKNP